jgi:outer membrane lipoprotein-sorting protein
MCHKRRNRAFLAAACIFVLVAHAALAVAAGPLDELRERQKGVSTVYARFTQEKHTALLPRPIKSSGEFYFKSPVGVRWIYTEAMEVVYDGKTLYIYYAEAREAEKISGAGGFVGPLTFDIDEMLKGYDVKAEKAGGDIRLGLRPLKEMPFASMQMTFRGGGAFPEEVAVLEGTGEKTVIRFHDVKTNLPLKDSLFKFEPPRGVTVRERSLER